MNLIKDLLAHWYDSNVQTVCELLFILGPVCFGEIWLMLKSSAAEVLRHDPLAIILFILITVPWIQSPRLSPRRRVSWCEKGKRPNVNSTALLQAFSLAIISPSVGNCLYMTLTEQSHPTQSLVYSFHGLRQAHRRQLPAYGDTGVQLW